MKWYQMSLGVKAGEYYSIDVPFALLGMAVSLAIGFLIGQVVRI